MATGAPSKVQVITKDTLDDFFPKIGSWICLDPKASLDLTDDKFEVLGSDSFKADEKFEVLDSYIVEIKDGNAKLKVKGHIIRKFSKDGDDDERLAFIAKKSSWHYVDPPSDEDLAEAMIARNNRMSCLECNHCKSITKKLLQCSKCKKVRYCGKDCQRKDWTTHENDCKKVKLIEIVNPCYPLKNPNKTLAAEQKEFQDQINDILHMAIKGNFKIKINEEWKKNPKVTELEHEKKYLISCPSPFLIKENYPYTVETILDPPTHCEKPTSCTLLQLLGKMYERDMKLNAWPNNIHSLVACWKLIPKTGEIQASPLFWGMVLNYKTFGTVAPFDKSCECNFTKMPTIWRKAQKIWDKAFTRATENINDVHCCFSDLGISDSVEDKWDGCHGYGLSGELRCRFNHNILVDKGRDSDAH